MRYPSEWGRARQPNSAVESSVVNRTTGHDTALASGIIPFHRETQVKSQVEPVETVR
jgi:hypothetical protein